MVNAFLLANKYTTVRADEINKLSEEFSHVDSANAGTIDKSGVKSVLDVLDEKVNEGDVVGKLKDSCEYLLLCCPSESESDHSKLSGTTWAQLGSGQTFLDL
jgi:hypothetical protein